MRALIEKVKKIEHGFNHIIEAGDEILSKEGLNHFELSKKYLLDDSYQVRMLATYLLGQLSPENPKALVVLETQVASDDNWRVQEMLAKAFDHYCKTIGYKNSLSTIEKWLADSNPNVKRAVIEGLRIWTSRPYFKENPALAVKLISKPKSEDSEYLRKSIGNALRDVAKKNRELVEMEIACWDPEDKKLAYIIRLVTKGK